MRYNKFNIWLVVVAIIDMLIERIQTLKLRTFLVIWSILFVSSAKITHCPMSIQQRVFGWFVYVFFDSCVWCDNEATKFKCHLCMWPKISTFVYTFDYSGQYWPILKQCQHQEIHFYVFMQYENYIYPYAHWITST